MGNFRQWFLNSLLVRLSRFDHVVRWSSRSLKQALPHELALCSATGTGKQSAADVSYELIHHVEFRHPLEDFDESGPRVALVADEEQPGVIFQTLSPRRPALRREVQTIVV
jgi:hypothetical protein